MPTPKYLRVPYTPAQVYSLLVRDFSGGLNTKDSATAIEQNQMASGSENVVIDERGAAKKRRGYAIVGASFGNAKVHSLFQYTKGATRRWLAGTTTKIVEYTGGSWGTDRKTGLTTGLALDFVTFKGISGAALVSAATATSGTINTITDTGAGWTVNAYQFAVAKITSGTGAGQVKLIDTNTADTLTLVETWDTTPDATSVFDIYALADCCFAGNGTDNLQRWDGVTATFTDLGATVPRFKYLEVHKNHLFGVDPAYPNTIRWSDVGQGEYYAPTSYLTLETNDGDVITGIKSFRTFLFVTKRNSCFLIVGDSTSEFRPQRIGDVGCRSNTTIQVYGAFLLFLGGDGKLYAFNGTSDPVAISNNVQPTLDAGATSLYDGCCSAVFDQRYYLFFPYDSSTSTYNDRALVSDLRPGRNFALTLYRDVPFASAHVGLDASGDQQFYVGDARTATNSTKVYDFEVGDNDNGAAIYYRVFTKRFDLESIARRKRLKYLFVAAKGQETHYNTQVYGGVDDKGFELMGSFDMFKDGFILGSSHLSVDTFGGADTLIMRYNVPTRVGRLVQFEFINSGVDQPVTLYGLELVYGLKKPR